MSNHSDGSNKLSFIIKKYPDGAFSSKLDAGLPPGTAVTAKGPYGSCFLREGRTGPMLLIGGGSGMSPLRAILSSHLASGERRPIRFFYGARTEADLFLLDEFAEIAAKLDDFKFIPALSHQADDDWDGERGFVHEVVQRHLKDEQFGGEIDAYSCGPPPMIDAVLPVLQMAGVEPSTSISTSSPSLHGSLATRPAGAADTGSIKQEATQRKARRQAEQNEDQSWQDQSSKTTKPKKQGRGNVHE